MTSRAAALLIFASFLASCAGPSHGVYGSREELENLKPKSIQTGVMTVVLVKNSVKDSELGTFATYHGAPAYSPHFGDSKKSEDNVSYGPLSIKNSRVDHTYRLTLMEGKTILKNHELAKNGIEAKGLTRAFNGYLVRTRDCNEHYWTAVVEGPSTRTFPIRIALEIPYYWSGYGLPFGPKGPKTPASCNPPLAPINRGSSG